MDFIEDFGVQVNKYKSSFASEAEIILRLLTSFSHILTITNHQIIFDLFIQVCDSGPHGPLVLVSILNL